MDKNNFKEMMDDLGIKLISTFSGTVFQECVRDEKFKLDCTGVTLDNRKVSIEIKIRKMTSDSPLAKQGVFIEDDKFSELIMRKIYRDHVPLYINFFDKGNTIAIWRLDKLPDEPKHENKRIESEVYGKVVEGRWLLPIDWAVIYKKDEEGKWKLQKRN